MGTFKKPRDKEHLNDLLFNHNHSIRKKAPIRSGSTPTFSTIMEKDKEFSENVKKLKKDFFKEQKETEKVSRGKRNLQDLLLAEPNAPSVVTTSAQSKKRAGPPRDNA